MDWEAIAAGKFEPTVGGYCRQGDYGVLMGLEDRELNPVPSLPQFQRHIAGFVHGGPPQYGYCVFQMLNAYPPDDQGSVFRAAVPAAERWSFLRRVAYLRRIYMEG